MFGLPLGKMRASVSLRHSEMTARYPVIRLVTLKEIVYKDIRVPLAVPLDVEIKFDGRKYVVYNDEVACFGEDRSFEVAMRELCSEFVGTMDLAEKYGRKSNEYMDRVMYHVEGR